MRWDVDPVLIDFGAVAIRWYGALFATGVLIAAIALSRLAARRGLDSEDSPAASVWLPIWLLAGMVLGAHWGHMLFYEPYSFVDDPVRIVQFGYGLASHGAVLGVVLALWLYCRKHRLRFAEHGDVLALGAVWVIPFIRVGNFFNSEIVGTPTTMPWGVVFVRRGFEEPRHPAQLYEALVGVVLIAFSLWLERRRPRPGVAISSILLIYFGARFFIEFVKIPQVLDANAPLTMGQILSLPLILAAALGLRWSTARPAPPR